MFRHSLASFLFVATPALFGQDWDATANAKGWARVDRDGSCVFHDAPGQSLRNWVKDGGLLGTVDISKLGALPDRWVLDSLGHAWVVVGTQLQRVEKSGKLGPKEALPGPVSDIAWDTRGFFLSYAGPTPFVEKRDYKTGAVQWSLGKRPAGEGDRRIAVTDDGNLIVWGAAGFVLTVLDGAKGKPIGDMTFNLASGGAAPTPASPAARGGLGWWLGHNVVFSAVPGSQVPASGINGLVLVRMDLSSGILAFLPSGVTEDHGFVGVTDTEAVLVNPKGGLVFVPIQ